MDKKRCAWVNLKNPIYVAYHDHEWGVPVKDDHLLFEMLILEGAQAGLNWETILKKRQAYRKAFKNFKPHLNSKLTDQYLEQQLQNPNIVRNRLKVYSVRKNAKVFINIQKEFGSFSQYLWDHVDHKPIVNLWKSTRQIPTKSDLSDKISKDLKKRGMSFVGSTIMYAFLQAVGVINDHTLDCDWCLKRCHHNSSIDPIF